MRDVGIEVWQGSDLVPGHHWGNYVLITARLSVLAARAELIGMRVPVNPRHNDKQSNDFLVSRAQRGVQHDVTLINSHAPLPPDAKHWQPTEQLHRSPFHAEGSAARVPRCHQGKTS